MREDSLPSKDQMIIETYLCIKQIEKRLDRHGVEHRDDSEKTWRKMDEIAKAHVDLSVDHGKRLTVLETEKNSNKGYITLIFSAIVAGIVGWFSKHL